MFSVDTCLTPAPGSYGVAQFRVWVPLVFRSLCEEEAPDDGLLFDATSVKVERIREDQEYGGERVTFEVRLQNARVTLQVDVGFGDAVTPRPEDVAFPTLLGMEAPMLRAYPRETVVAEKLEAMVKLGLANSRMKDFYDVLLLARTFLFEGRGLRDAIRATFTRRGTAIPRDTPVALTETFGRDQVKVQQWRAFLTRSELTEEGGELPAVVGELAAFLVPPMAAAERGEEFEFTWGPRGRWAARSSS